MSTEKYIDLTDESTDLSLFSIIPGGYDCSIVDQAGKSYDGFLLARSLQGNALTICDVSFQWSKKDRKYPPRLTFRRTTSELADIPVKKGQYFQRITFEDGQDGYREYWEMVAFLAKFKNLVDIGKFIDKYQVATEESVVIRLKSKNVEQRMAEIERYVEAAEMDPNEMSEILAHRARKDDLRLFKQLLDNTDDSRNSYREKYKAEIKGAADEALWHHFLSNHKWIFGLSLDLRFLEDFVDEASVGNPDTANHGNPKTDMLAWSDYTVLVELKTPETKLFTSVKTSNARANTWSFTPAFIEGFSQCLAQKQDWTENFQSKTVTVEDDGVKRALDKGIIRTIDPQVIYLVGNKEDEIPKNDNAIDTYEKRDTLERFIRNNRNVNIVSYDELYTRAHHIVYGDVAETEPEAEVKTTEEILDEWDF